MANKVKIRINSNDKIEELLQETYNQACEQITQVQEEMNKITQSTSLADLTVEEKAKYAKIMHDYSGDKDRAIRAKMDIAKLLIEIVNHKGSVEEALNDKTFTKQPSTIDFNALKKELNSDKPTTYIIG
jgi:galactokinase